MTQVVILVHGMGNDAGGPSGEPNSKKWAADHIALLTDACVAFPGVAASDVVFESVLYDDVFRAHALTWQALAEQFAGTPLESFTGWMKTAGEGGFAWGSLGDVAQYRLLKPVRQHVTTSVASQLANIIKKHGLQQHYSIVAHSLGTAVAHDSLQALATLPIDGSTAAQPPGFRFDNFFALANVSRLVWATDDGFYDDTRVRPLASGRKDDECYVNHYVSFRHVADPIASLVRFRPKNWSTAAFQSIELRHFRDVNVHGFLHYLASPNVSDRILMRLFPLLVTKSLRKQRALAYRDYEQPNEQGKKGAVDLVAAALDKFAGQPQGNFTLSLRALVELLEFVGASAGLPV